MRLGALAAVAAAALVVAACQVGGDGDAGEAVGAADTELLQRASAALDLQASAPTSLPGGGTYRYTPALAYADLDAARTQLGLPPDAAVGSGRSRLLFTIASRPLFQYARAFRPEADLGPLAAVIDIGQVKVAVGTNMALPRPGTDEVGPEDVLLVRTFQDPAEITEALRQAGYRRAAGGVLAGADPLPERDGSIRVASNFDGVPFPAAGSTGAGVFAFGGSARVVRAALSEDLIALHGLARFVAELPGVSRAARAFKSSCVELFGIGEDASPREGELVVAVDGDADGERDRLAGKTLAATFFSNSGGEEASGATLTLADAVAKGNRATAAFSSSDEANVTRLAAEDVARPYRCP